MHDNPEKVFAPQKCADGSFEVTFRTPYIYGDFVAYASPYNGQGEGTICDIVLSADGGYYYYIELENGEIQPGIMPAEITLIRRGRVED